MYKQVIIINSSIKLSKGKAAAQSAHAAVSALHEADDATAKKWKKEGQKKIVVKASLEELLKAEEKCKKFKIAYALISDAGKTEIEQGTVTALGIGPDSEEKINKITGSMKLLK